MNNELNDEILLLAPKEEDQLEEYTQFEIYLPYPKEEFLQNSEEPRRVPAIRTTYKDPTQEFINREFRELNFSSRNCFGSWHGEQEISVVITYFVLTSEALPIYKKFEEIAKKYKEEFKQETVLITVNFIRAKFV